MNDLPRREPTPLYPDPGRFERTLRRARRRRARATAATAVAALVVAGGGVFALVSTQTPLTRQTATTPSQLTASSSLTNRPSAPTPTASPAPSPGAGQGTPTHGGPTGHHSTGQGHGPSGIVPPPSAGHSPSHSSGTTDSGSPSHGGSARMYRGVVVDRSGSPVGDVAVYVAPATGGTPQKVDTTAPNGTFEAPCSDGPILLATQDFGPADSSAPPAPDSPQSRYGYTYAQGSAPGSAPSCGGGSSAVRSTVLPAAGSLSVTVTDANGNPVDGSTQPGLFCNAVSTDPCYSPLTDSAGDFTFSGLTPGRYTLRDGTTSKDVTISAGQTAHVDWPLSQPSSSSSPTSPEPTPTSGPTSQSSAPVSPSEKTSVHQQSANSASTSPPK